jgi:hypothetical protein
MIDDPLSLLSLGIWLMAAGMWPVGFLFGACSACCDEVSCECGPAGTDLADWCCSGTHPEEITVRISNGTEEYEISEGCSFECISGTIQLNCASFNGDYVLTRGGGGVNTFGDRCQYGYAPGPECDEEEYDCPDDPDPPGAAFFVGPNILVKVCDQGIIDNADTVPGPGYDIGVLIEGFCEATWDGKPTIYSVRGGGCNDNPFKPNSAIPFRTRFEESNCDLRGDVSGTIEGSGFGDLYFPAEVGLETSCDTCGSTVVGSCDERWFVDPEVICFDGGDYSCSWDIEILPP